MRCDDDSSNRPLFTVSQRLKESVRRFWRLLGENIQAGRRDSMVLQGLCYRIDVDDFAATGVNQNAIVLHARKGLAVYEAPRFFAQRGMYGYDIGIPK